MTEKTMENIFGFSKIYRIPKTTLSVIIIGNKKYYFNFAFFIWIKFTIKRFALRMRGIIGISLFIEIFFCHCKRIADLRNELPVNVEGTGSSW